MTKTYGAEINLDIDNAHTRVLHMVGSGTRVLELGCGIGHMTRALAARRCQVTVVEVNADAAEQARSAAVRVIVGDLDDIDWADAFGAECFDVIVAADVLEHLRDPVHVLAQARRHLADDGKLVASIPNIAHVSVIAELLQGRFPYQPNGLLDDTHIRFFVRHSVYECVENAGFEISSLERVTVRPEETEFHTDLSSFPPEVAAYLEAREEATTYQFILSARPAPMPLSGLGHLPPRAPSAWSPIRPSAVGIAGDGLDGFLQAVAGRWASVESERQHRTALVATLREQLTKSETHIGWLTSEIQRRKAELDEMKRQAARSAADAGRPSSAIVPVSADSARQREDFERQMDAASKARDEMARAHAAVSRRLIDERLRFGAELDRLRLECDRRAPQIKALRHLSSAIERSKRWRVAAPLRWSSRVLRRLAKRAP
jgi:2-polyprenyl-3-methyl-5-hydroxy-6-metoxy-1,4-benzoquinol methylase